MNAICSRGMAIHGEGFIVTPAEAAILVSAANRELQTTFDLLSTAAILRDSLAASWPSTLMDSKLMR